MCAHNMEQEQKTLKKRKSNISVVIENKGTLKDNKQWSLEFPVKQGFQPQFQHFTFPQYCNGQKEEKSNLN